MRSTRPALPITGGCSCGAIRYEIASFPLLLYTCNCTDCQTASGSAFALNMPVAWRAMWPEFFPQNLNSSRKNSSIFTEPYDVGQV